MKKKQTWLSNANGKSRVKGKLCAIEGETAETEKFGLKKTFSLWILHELLFHVCFKGPNPINNALAGKFSFILTENSQEGMINE